MLCELKIYTDSGLIDTIETKVGTKLIDLLITDHSLNAPCGGRGTCGKCRVRAKGQLSAIGDTEYGLLSAKDRESGVRLACLTTIEGDADVWLSEENARILTSGGDEMQIAADPDIICEKICVPLPSLEDQRSDISRLCDAAQIDVTSIPLKLLSSLPRTVRESNGEIWLTKDRRGGKIRDIDTKEPELYAAAIDIGTTTIAAYLIDLKSGASKANCSAMNPQRAYGADVISRIDYASAENGLTALQRSVTAKLTEMIDGMLNSNGINRAALRKIMCVGNTVMVHLLLGVDPSHIAVSPFIPAFTDGRRVNAGEIGMPFENAVIETGPCVAGYIGADTTAAVIACAMGETAGNSLLIDIGTNGEIALGGREGIVCCSAAAGPAFEGAHIRCGSGAVEGAISGVRLNDDGGVELETIGNAKPSSICGSGLVDAIAELLRCGIMDETGRIDEDEAPEIWEERIFDSQAGLAFALTEDRSVFICQKDIREVQLAKGAIAAGIQILLNHTKVGFDNIDKLFLAGGFGNFIDVHNACMIGLLPQEMENRAVPVGNAAGTGARMLALNSTISDACSKIAHNMKYIELSSQREFTDLFSENMLFEI